MTREIVTSARDYYVSVNGDSANSGTSPSSPWPIQHAIDYVCHGLEIDNARVTIHAAQPGVNESYPPIMLNPWFGTCNSDPGAVSNGIPDSRFTVPCLIGGTLDTMSNFRIKSPSGTQILCFGNSQPWFVSGFTCMADDGTGQAILADRRACLYLGNMLHGQSGDHVTAIVGSFIEYLRGSTQRFYGQSQRHATTLGPGSHIAVQSATVINGVTIPAAALQACAVGTSWPNFTHCFAYARGPNGIELDEGVFSGDATGLREQGQLGGYVTMPAGSLPSLS